MTERERKRLLGLIATSALALARDFLERALREAAAEKVRTLMRGRPKIGSHRKSLAK